MSEKPSSHEEHKFDTLSLLAGLTDEDTGRYSIDDIMSEFGTWKEKKQEKTAPPPPKAAPVQEEKPEPVLRDIPSVQAVIAAQEEPVLSIEEEVEQEVFLIDQIQHAIDRELELNMATPEPVIQLDVEPEPEQEDAQDFGDPELNALFRDKNIRLVDNQAQTLPKEPDSHGAVRIEEEDEDEEEETPKRPHREHSRREKSQDGPRLEVVEDPEPVPDAAELYKKSVKAIRPARSRMTAVLVLTVAAILWTAANQMGWSEAAVFASNQTASKVLLAFMVLCALLAFDVVKDGVKGIVHLKLGLNSLSVLIFLIAAIDAILCGDDDAIPFCAVVCVQFYFAVWGGTLRKVGLRRALKPLQKQEKEPKGISLVEQAWEGGGVAAAHEGGSAEAHVRGLLDTNLTEERMRIYTPVVIVLSLILAFIVRFKTGNSLTWAWSSMMIGALPVAGFISFYRPFAVLSGRLMKTGSAVSGWKGASRLNEARGIILRDQDVFPTEQVTLNGMKVYGSCTVGQAVSYAAAVIEVSGSGLTPLFQELRATNNARFFTVSQFRRYESGGYGAEIGGDVILLGSLRFMQLMGVYMHEGTRVRNAVYLSVNGEMCAVFALNYAPAGKVRRALREITDASGLKPVFATRDILITPLFVEERYKVPNDSLEFPGAEERNRLAELPGDYPAAQSALLLRDSFNAFTDAVVGARLLKLVTSLSTTINLVGGAVGLALMFLLTYLGAQSAVTAINMLIFALVWSLPTLILTNWVGRY